MTEFTPLTAALIIGTGFIAGVVNTLAGGGSNLTVPALMVLGMPADVANGTNRIGVVLQSMTAMRGFHRAGRLDTHDIGPVLVPNLLGGLIGSVFAARMPVEWLKHLLLGTMIGLSLLILLRPSVVAPPLGTVPFRVRERPLAWLALFVAGLYGGFVQGGVGFVLIAALAGTLRYDLIRTNALKTVCTLAFTLVSLAVFIAHGQVLWVPGLVLGLATMCGAALGVRLSLRLSPALMKWFLLLMTLVASAVAMSS